MGNISSLVPGFLHHRKSGSSQKDVKAYSVDPNAPKPPTLPPYFNLARAQLATHTETGLKVKRQVVRLMTRKDISQILKEKLPEDKRLVLTHPLARLDKITDHLYLTGVGGLVEENMNELGITGIFNATYELPIWYHPRIQFYRIPVRSLRRMGCVF